MILEKAAAGVVTAGNGIYNIGFNDNDETQFSADGLWDLLELWNTFCTENGFPIDSVDYVERTQDE
ncbi:MAG: hypothetical protein HFH69_12635 [Lachnospiraceae bacterium]|nr:hypothetical protein [Lachnospiraceae bacterium]